MEEPSSSWFQKPRVRNLAPPAPGSNERSGMSQESPPVAAPMAGLSLQASVGLWVFSPESAQESRSPPWTQSPPPCSMSSAKSSSGPAASLTSSSQAFVQESVHSGAPGTTRWKRNRRSPPAPQPGQGASAKRTRPRCVPKCRPSRTTVVPARSPSRGETDSRRGRRGSAGSRARARFRRPALSTLPPSPGSQSVPDRSRSIRVFTPSCGKRPASRATAPVTCGAAMEVPDHSA